MKNLLKELDACEQAREWAADKNWEEIYKTCHRGDWFLWLFKKTNPNDLQLLTLASGNCANTVRHLMKDKRSINAVDAAIAFGLGEITKDELAAAANAANAAYAAWSAADAAAAAYAAYAAASASSAAADAAYAAAYADAAKKENQQQTADIVRKYISIEKFNIKLN